MAGRFQSSFGVRNPVLDDIRSVHVRRCVNLALPQSVRLHESVAQLSPTHKRAHLDSVCTSPSKRQKRRCRWCLRSTPFLASIPSFTSDILWHPFEGLLMAVAKIAGFSARQRRHTLRGASMILWASIS